VFEFFEYHENMRNNVTFQRRMTHRVGLSSGICKCSAIGPEDAEAVAGAEMDGYWMLGTGAEKEAETGTVMLGF